MPDRFDLMYDADVRSAFRITADYCRLANPERLTTEDVARLDRGRNWLTDLGEHILRATESGVLDPEILESAPLTADRSASPSHALQLFATANDEVRDVVVEKLLKAPKATLASSGGKVSNLDLARHLARISNSTSVDRRWIWD
jgi:hypothetical protein